MRSDIVRDKPFHFGDKGERILWCLL